MIALWDPIIRGLVDTVQANNVLEVGAETGLSTKVLLDYVTARGGHLHSIDPAPDFDVSNLEHQYPGSVTFHRDLSLNAIPHLPCVDVALLDGDHNWYTVFHELELLEKLHAGDPLNMPVIFIHDIGWPYGRRDLYYTPHTIPKEHRKPFAKKGMGRLKRDLLEHGGLNSTLHNAITEGGANNGVLTAIESYLDETAVEYHFVNLPLYFGLGILVTKARLDNNNELNAELMRLEGFLAGRKLIELTERFRLKTLAQLQQLQIQLEDEKKTVSDLKDQLAITKRTSSK